MFDKCIVIFSSQVMCSTASLVVACILHSFAHGLRSNPSLLHTFDAPLMAKAKQAQCGHIHHPIFFFERNVNKWHFSVPFFISNVSFILMQ